MKASHFSGGNKLHDDHEEEYLEDGEAARPRGNGGGRDIIIDFSNHSLSGRNDG